MAAKKPKPAKKKSASPAGAKKKARGKNAKPAKRGMGAKKHGAHTAPPPAAVNGKAVEPETPIEPPVLPTPSASFTF